MKHGSPLGYVINGWSLNDSFQAQNGLPFADTAEREDDNCFHLDGVVEWHKLHLVYSCRWA